MKTRKQASRWAKTSWEQAKTRHERYHLDYLRSTCDWCLADLCGVEYTVYRREVNR